MTAPKLQAGDRVAYTAKFLRDFCIHTGPLPARRGTFMAYEGEYARVRWDDFDAEYIGSQYGEDYVEDVRQFGQRVLARNVTRVGSAAFAHSDL